MEVNKLSTEFLEKLVKKAMKNQDGLVASYIPELANVNQEITAVAVKPIGGSAILYSNEEFEPVTLQSSAKLVPLIGLLEEKGPDNVFKWVNVEPSGDDFASIRHLAQFGPKPSNPMLNSGAITLCSHIPGTCETQFAWLDNWIQKLYNQKLSVNTLVYNSEKKTGDRNRALAYLLNTKHNLGSTVEKSLELYFTLCSYQATIEQTVYLPALLANLGKDPDTGEQVISSKTAEIALSIMTTCGLYDESGEHLVRTGIPAKSSVSGFIIASVPHKAGISVFSPRVNNKGNSIRGEIILEELSKELGWHFAAP